MIANGFLRDVSAVAPAFARLSLLRRFWLLRCRIFQRPRRRRLAFERIVETRRGLDGLVGVKLLVPRRRREGAVHSFVREIKQKRLFVFGLHKVQGVFVEQIGHVAVHFGSLAIHVEDRVLVCALAFEADPSVKTGPRRIVVAHVPLADASRLVARVVKQARKSDQLVAERGMIGVVNHAVSVRILARQKAPATRRAQRNGHKKVPEQRPFLRNAVNVRRFDKRMAHATQRIPAQIVHEDENNVRPRGGLSGPRRGR